MKAGALELARFVALRDSIAFVARVLAPAGIAVAPLKGALLVVGYVGGPTARITGDVDLLVADDRFEESVRLLVAAGGTIPLRNPDGRTETLEFPGVPFPIDLHRRLFRRGLYAFDEAAILARCRRDDAAFGVAVELLSPEDALAHQLAHHAGGRPLGSAARLALDLAVLEARVDLAGALTRLREAGLVRALLFVQGDLRARGRASAMVDRLAELANPSFADRASATLALRIAAGGATGASSLARHLTNQDLGAGLRSLAFHVASSIRGRMARSFAARR